MTLKNLSYWVLVLSFISNNGFCHALGMSLLFLEHRDAGAYKIKWNAAKDLEHSVTLNKIKFPQHCKRVLDTLDCGDRGLYGEIRVSQLPPHAEVLIRIQQPNTSASNQVITGKHPVYRINNMAKNSGDSLETSPFSKRHHWTRNFANYTYIGLEHIVYGYDHLLFVLGLILLVGFSKRLVLTVSLFTLAHSVTLAMSIFSLISIPSPVVEMVIALSITLVAKEAMETDLSLSKRAPWLMALIFGLVHGLGFAGALRDLGLPEASIPASLLAFNMGVELGQLGIILFIYFLFRVCKAMSWHKKPITRQSLRLCCYSIGAVGAFWTIERGSQFFSV
ncbi:MAG: HupE/UreJ family protein [Cellvibrionaceae bacterium]|nr:HupE/UreJ family protein [Cellvibrionaceae bacterium]